MDELLGMVKQAGDYFSEPILEEISGVARHIYSIFLPLLIAIVAYNISVNYIQLFVNVRLADLYVPPDGLHCADITKAIPKRECCNVGGHSI